MSEYTIELEWDTVQGIVKQVLIDDFQKLSIDIEYLRSIGERRMDHQTEDLHFNERIRDAIAIVMEYYLSEDDRNEVLKNHKTKTPNELYLDYLKDLDRQHLNYLNGLNNHCSVCGMSFTDSLGRPKVMGYVCSNNRCPSNPTSAASVTYTYGTKF